MLPSYRILLLTLGVVAGIAQPVPKLNSISREWIERGAVRDVTLAGENLSGVTNLIVSGGAGVSARIIPPPEVQVQVESSGAGVTSVARPNGNSLQVELSLDSNAALTDRELRVVSPEGVSNPLTLRVSPLPEIDAANNVSRETAQKVELPAAINGTIQNAAESDFFTFTGKKGEHLIADVYAFRLGSKLDSSLAVLDKSGKELARNEDAVGLDSVLDFEVPEDGDYLIELRDFRYQGGGDFKYRMMLGVLPHVTRAFPFGAQRGQTVDIALEGANLDSKKLTLNLATNAATGRQEIRASSSSGLVEMIVDNGVGVDAHRVINRGEQLDRMHRVFRGR